MDHFELITDGSELPVFAFALKPGIENYTVFDLSERLRDRGWLVPAYSFPENRQDLDALRIVVRNGMSRDLADLLVADLQAAHRVLRQARRHRCPTPAVRASATDMGRLDGKSVLVIGGAQGIGRGCVLAAAEAGADVLVADLNEAGARGSRAGGDRAWRACDSACAATWSSATQVDALVGHGTGEFGQARRPGEPRLLPRRTGAARRAVGGVARA